jgi:hypothetical protein
MLRSDVLVAAHAAIDRRDTGEWRSAHSCMTQLAVELVVEDVDSVAEIDGLVGLVLRRRG